MSNLVNRGKDTIKQHRKIFENFSWVAALELFVIVAPLITYPYLTGVLGLELYGYIITAQVLVGYATLIIDFGSNSVVAKHVSINRNDKTMLSEIVSSVLIVRGFLCAVCFVIYCGIVALIPSYRSHYVLFLLSYGLTLNDVLFPRYFFQGIENMKVSSLINIGIKLLFILLVFLLVKTEGDYLLVPVLYTIGYTLAGIVSMYLIFNKMGLRFYKPPISRMMIYVKDSSSIFATNLITTIKDYFNYFLLGGFSGMSNVVVYDLGVKINVIINKPIGVISQVLFPRFAQNRDERKLNKIMWGVFWMTLGVVVIINIFMPWIVDFFLHEKIDLLPLRIFSISPIFLSVSSFLASNFFVAFSHNKYLLYSIIITTIAYLGALGLVAVTDHMSSVYSFVSISLFSYFVEFLYRVIIKEKLMRKEENASTK